MNTETIPAGQDYIPVLAGSMGRFVPTIAANATPRLAPSEETPNNGSLTFQRLRDINHQRSLKWHNGGLEEWTVSDWAVAMAGEAGEVCDAVKKLRRIETGAPNKSKINTVDAAYEAIGEEIADTLLYLDLLAQRCGFRLEDVVKAKFNAVSAKYGFPERL